MYVNSFYCPFFKNLFCYCFVSPLSSIHLSASCYPCNETKDITCFCKTTKVTVPCGKEKVTRPPRCNLPCKSVLCCQRSLHEESLLLTLKSVFWSCWITVEPLLKDHPRHWTKVVIKEGRSSVKGLFTELPTIVHGCNLSHRCRFYYAITAMKKSLFQKI